jgi:hypothetical protein
MPSELVRTKDALETTRERSWKLTLNGILTTTAQVTKKELTPGELLLWEQLLSSYQTEGVQWAFMEYLRTGKFFPAPGEITELYSIWVTEENNKKRDAAARRDREETERRRARGETIGIHDVLREFNEIVSAKKMPAAADPEPNRRVELQEQKARIMRAIEKARRA